MSDLISRSKLIEKLWDEHKKIEDECYGYTDADEVKEVICGIVSIIDTQPTAYDIDNVIKELKGASWEETDISTVIYTDEAIEIVKQGGVADDECEWKMTDTKKLMPYETSCGNEDLYDNSYKYCPYCGKKILCKE